MPIPYREAAVQALQDGIAALLPDVPLERERRARVQPEHCPLLVLLPGDVASDDSQNFGEVARTLMVTIEGYCAVTTEVRSPDAGRRLGAMLSELHARAVEAACTEASLAEFADQISEGEASFTSWTVEETDVPFGFFSLDLTIEYRTPIGRAFLPA